MRKRRRQGRSKGKGILLFSLTLLSITAILSWSFGEKSETAKNKEIAQLGSLPIVSQLYYDMDVRNKKYCDRRVAQNEFFADILLKERVAYEKIYRLVQNGKDIFDVRTLRAGKDLSFIYDENEKLETLIYDPSAYYYFKFNIEEESVTKIERPVKKVISRATGRIESSMWNAIIDAGLNPGIAQTMEDAFAWSVDMYHVQKGDEFSLIFEEEIVNGQKVNYGKLIAGHFRAGEADHYAFLFNTPKHNGYFDLKGRPMKKAFLKSPVKYGRISSSFNRNRFHPVLKRVRPHLGTDYAAAHGTPILAVAAGTVIKASYSGGNGRYVKIKHDDTYTTQYLHMSKYGKGIKSGTRVKQGQVIGYVGSTGLATGPHVCFRFWKNGRQVNHLREKLPPPEPMPKEYLPEYFKVKDGLKLQLDDLERNSPHFKDGVEAKEEVAEI